MKSGYVMIIRIKFGYNGVAIKII